MRYAALTLIIFGVTIAGVVIRPTINNISAAQQSAAAAVPHATPKPAKVKTAKTITFTDGEFDGIEIVKTDAEWKSILNATEYYVLRQEGTEHPYTGSLWDKHTAGTYYCGACGLALFSSATKFDSETGWPSFYEPKFKKNVTEIVDNKLSEERIEIECSRCHSHIGHVFDDGPEPTGLRYCMNSAALRFKPNK